MYLFGILMLIVGVVFLVMGLNTSQALTERVVEKFTGRFTTRTMRNLVIGILLILIGVALIYFGLPNKS